MGDSEEQSLLPSCEREIVQDEDDVDKWYESWYIKGPVLLLAYMLLSIVVYGYLEGWSPLDCCYFSVQTLTTVGYGDLSPTSEASKMVTVIFVFVGLYGIMSAVSEGIQHLVLQQEDMIAEASDDGGRSGTKQGEVAAWRNSDRSKHRRLMALGTIVTFGALSCLFFMVVEGMDFINAFYGACITVTTVGYGDVTIDSTWGRAISIVLLLLGTVAVGNALGTLIDISLEEQQKAVAARVLMSKMTAKEAREADMSGDGKVSEAEYVVAKLLEMDYIKDDVVKACQTEFHEKHGDKKSFVIPKK